MRKRSLKSRVRTMVLGTLTNFFADLHNQHPSLSRELRRDLSTIIKRYEEEGLSFLTETLPRLGKAIYRSFETGFFDIPMGFKKDGRSNLPCLFRGFWRTVYDRNGCLQEDYDPTLFVDVIQLCFFFYKLELPYSPKKVKKVIDNFIEVEDELKNLHIKCDDPVLLEAQSLITKYFKSLDLKNILPKHGPGCVATGEKFEEKWHFTRKYEDIHRVYPYYEYFVSTRSHLFSDLLNYKKLLPLKSGVAKVSLVPKDSRGPRLISMEPLEYQFIQQGVKNALYEYIEKKCPLTRGYVNFTDQTINGSLALESSITKHYSTLDMKEASDRVSLQLVELLFSGLPEILKCLKAVRTKHTALPDGTILPLAKFAPMGSAICFPVEALIFFVLAKAIQRVERIPGEVFIYGDDIIAPHRLTPRLFELFPKYGLKFNEDKCFTDGYFRESCGVDALKGVICTPIRFRRIVPKTAKNASAVVSSVDLSNALYLKGYWRTADYLRGIIPLRNLPVTPARKVGYSYLSYKSFSACVEKFSRHTKKRINADLQLEEHRLFCFLDKTRKTTLDGYPRLFSTLVGQSVGKWPVPQAGALKLRWLDGRKSIADMHC